MGGAGRTASGLAMLMGNAAKILQTVAANIDNDVIKEVINALYDMVMLTDTTGLLRGDESIKVLGVQVAMQRETQRQRQLEFLQITANPIGLGYALIVAQESMKPDRMFVFLIWIGFLGWLVNAVLLRAQQRWFGRMGNWAEQSR